MRAARSSDGAKAFKFQLNKQAPGAPDRWLPAPPWPRSSTRAWHTPVRPASQPSLGGPGRRRAHERLLRPTPCGSPEQTRGVRLRRRVKLVASGIGANARSTSAGLVDDLGLVPSIVRSPAAVGLAEDVRGHVGDLLQWMGSAGVSEASNPTRGGEAEVGSHVILEAASEGGHGVLAVGHLRGAPA